MVDTPQELDAIVISDTIMKLLAAGKSVAVFAVTDDARAEIVVTSANMPERTRYRMSRMALDLMLLTRQP